VIDFVSTKITTRYAAAVHSVPIWRDYASAPVRIVRVLLGAFGLFVVIRQANISIGQLGFPASHFFSYFTILSNILADAVLIVYGVFPSIARRGDAFRGATALYIAITGVLYNALLRGIDVATTEAWLNEVLHVVIPVVLALDWLIVAQVQVVSWRLSLTWLAFPLAYLAYSLIRGPIVDWYPYPFVDPRLGGGYWRVAGYGVVLAVVMAVLSVGFAYLGARFSRKSILD
jgi:lysylphosphatidylglycerol synthetase-like protein (DUF2156 family)